MTNFIPQSPRRTETQPDTPSTPEKANKLATVKAIIAKIKEKAGLGTEKVTKATSLESRRRFAAGAAVVLGAAIAGAPNLAAASPDNSTTDNNTTPDNNTAADDNTTTSNNTTPDNNTETDNNTTADNDSTPDNTDAADNNTSSLEGIDLDSIDTEADLEESLLQLGGKTLEMINSYMATASFALAIKNFLTDEHFTPQNWTSAILHLLTHNSAQLLKGGVSELKGSLAHLAVDVGYLVPVLMGTTMGDILEEVAEEIGVIESFQVDENASMATNIENLYNFCFENAHIASLSSGAMAIQVDRHLRNLMYAKKFKPALNEYKKALDELHSAASDDSKQRILAEFIESEFAELDSLCQETLDEAKINDRLLTINEAFNSIRQTFETDENSTAEDHTAIEKVKTAHSKLMAQVGYGLVTDSNGQYSVEFSEEEATKNQEWAAIKEAHQALRSLSNLLGQMVIGDPPNFLLLFDKNLSFTEKVAIQTEAMASVMSLLTVDCEKSIRNISKAFDGKDESWTIRGEWGQPFMNTYKIIAPSILSKLTGIGQEGGPKQHAVHVKGPIIKKTILTFADGLIGSLGKDSYGSTAKDDTKAIEKLQNGELVPSEVRDIEGRKGNRIMLRVIKSADPQDLKEVLEELIPDTTQRQSLLESIEAVDKKVALEEGHQAHHHLDWGDAGLVEAIKNNGVDANMLRIKLIEKSFKNYMGKGNLNAKAAYVREIYAESGQKGKTEKVLDYFSDFIHQVKDTIGIGTEEVLALVLLQVLYLQSVMPVIYQTIDGIVGDNIKRKPNGEWEEEQEVMPKETFNEVVTGLIVLCSVSAVADNLAMYMACGKVLARMLKSGLISHEMYKFGATVCYQAAIGFGAWTPAGGPASAPHRDNPGNAFRKGAPTVLANASSKIPLIYQFSKKWGVDIQEDTFTRIAMMITSARGLQETLGSDIAKSAASSISSLIGGGVDKAANSNVVNKITNVTKLTLVADRASDAIIGDKPAEIQHEKESTIHAGVTQLKTALQETLPLAA